MEIEKLMEMRGIEPLASTMLKSHSTTEPHPITFEFNFLKYILFIIFAHNLFSNFEIHFISNATILKFKHCFLYLSNLHFPIFFVSLQFK